MLRLSLQKARKATLLRSNGCASGAGIDVVTTVTHRLRAELPAWRQTARWDGLDGIAVLKRSGWTSASELCKTAGSSDTRLALMKTILPLILLVVMLTACSAPQGKKYAASNRELPPIALPIPVAKADLYESQQGNIVALKPGGTLTVWLSSVQKSGYGWRLAEIPDSTVLKLISSEYSGGSAARVGQEKWVFQAVGGGDVDLRLWYTSPRREQFGSAPVFKCVVSVVDGLAAVATGPDAKAIRPVKMPHAPKGKARPKIHRQPKVPRTTPDSETAPFLVPIFRSSGVPMRDERDGRQQQG